MSADLQFYITEMKALQIKYGDDFPEIVAKMVQERDFELENLRRANCNLRGRIASYEGDGC